MQSTQHNLSPRGGILRRGWPAGAVLAIALLLGLRTLSAERGPGGFAAAGPSEPTLAGADFREADLEDAQLCSANLARAKLCLARLTNATLAGANLTRADLRAADLTGADLRGADMRGADLAEADLLGARYDAATRWPASAW